MAAVTGVAGVGALPHLLAAAPRNQITVWKTPNCGCCKEWVKHLEANGFDVVTNDVKETTSKRKALGLPEKYGSCHTGTVNGYVLKATCLRKTSSGYCATNPSPWAWRSRACPSAHQAWKWAVPPTRSMLCWC